MNHNMQPLPRPKRFTASIAWRVCARCGLIELRNQASKQAVRAACPGRDD